MRKKMTSHFPPKPRKSAADPANSRSPENDTLQPPKTKKSLETKRKATLPQEYKVADGLKFCGGGRDSGRRQKAPTQVPDPESLAPAINRKVTSTASERSSEERRGIWTVSRLERRFSRLLSSSTRFGVFESRESRGRLQRTMIRMGPMDSIPIWRVLRLRRMSLRMAQRGDS
ncbi:hypothetical protein DOTSEDRAFT_72269 [Dothistroma septosporum NZE10]|uniref:Uncharacterized protein n=1 Tax=Dothistroma septosporum (strain NZE10 / CBS 128990) TaxID=675120 RepID=N1PQX5_DOTSN|nr:hypothetical protein DOTSEDRAFT_72269 [Dothistroma septosporum NZE10]